MKRAHTPCLKLWRDCKQSVPSHRKHGQWAAPCLELPGTPSRLQVVHHPFGNYPRAIFKLLRPQLRVEAGLATWIVHQCTTDTEQKASGRVCFQGASRPMPLHSGETLRASLNNNLLSQCSHSVVGANGPKSTSTGTLPRYPPASSVMRYQGHAFFSSLLLADRVPKTNRSKFLGALLVASCSLRGSFQKDSSRTTLQRYSLLGTSF